MASKAASSQSNPRRILYGLAAALSAWGAYLAVGATGVFTDVGLFDVRRSVIVLACSVCFVGFWLAILYRRGHRRAESPDALLNFSSLLSLITILLAFGVWGLSWMAWLSDSFQSLTYPLAGFSVFLFATALIAALVGLSDPRRQRYKLLGLLTLGLTGGAIFLFALQVNRYTQRGAARPLVPAGAPRDLAQPILPTDGLKRTI